MNWNKIQEDVVKIILGMVVTAFGGATVWAITTVIQHERKLIMQEAENTLLKEQLKHAKDRDEELITLMAEEIRKLKTAVEESCAHMAEEKAKPEFPISPLPQPQPEKPEKDPKKVFDKFFPPEQRTDDYQRILRDKFNQRTEQQIQMQQIEK